MSALLRETAAAAKVVICPDRGGFDSKFFFSSICAHDMALAALALALAAPAARRLEVDYEGYKKLAMEGNAEALQQKFKHASPEEQLAIKNEILRMRGEKPVELPERKQGGGGGGGGKRLARGSDGKMHDVADPVEAGKEFARRHGMDGARCAPPGTRLPCARP